MSWQDIYGEMEDDCGGNSHTRSRRGIVKHIGFHVVTTEPGGSPIDISVTRADRNKTFNIGDIKRKIQQWKNKEQSRTLATLRATLLPMLISGELRVKDAEFFMET